MPERREFDPTSQALIELINKHGMRNVPSEELEKLGYVRDTQGNVVKASELEQRLEAGKEQETKEKDRPFDVISFDLPVKRSLLRHESTLAIKFDREFPRGSVEEFLPSTHPYVQFEDQLEGYLLTQKNNFDRKLVSNDWLSSPDWEYYLLYKREGEDEFRGIIDDLEIADGLKGRLDWLREEGDEEEVNQYLQTIQRVRARYTDKAELRMDFHKWDRELDLEEAITEGDRLSDLWVNPEFKKYCEKNDIRTMEALKVYLVGNFLVQKGFTALGQDIENYRTYDQIEDRLKRLTAEDFPHTQIKKEIDALMDNAGNIDEKKKLSSRKKEIETLARQENRLIEGLKAYIMPYEIVANFYDRIIDRLEEASFRIKKGETDSVQYILDATSNEKLDKDPGKVSGDCTEGEPLPFSDPHTPVYNVKVFEENKAKHIGNIYLLITKTSEEELVWHLDAIQIPALIDWKNSMETFVSTIAEQAKAKGVKYITVNDKPEIISNYNYIADAVADYIITKGNTTELVISLPKVDKSLYSNFQSSGLVQILWENREN